MNTSNAEMDALQIGGSTSSSMFWGGLSGSLELVNTSSQNASNWSFSFISTYAEFDFYNANQTAILNADGTYTITVSAATGSPALVAGESMNLGFTVNSSTDADVTLEEVFLTAAEASFPTTAPSIPTDSNTGGEETNNDAAGRIFDVDVNAGEITDFRPGIDSLNFGGTSVHNLIAGKTNDGFVTFLSPWNGNRMTLVGVSYTDLERSDYGIVGNEHLRQDLGGVVSWETGVGARDNDTVYILSHEYGKSTVVSDFDVTTDKISFLYYGTRERLSATDTVDGLLIRTEPTGQSFLLEGVQKSELIPAHLEFHHDQIIEDNLENAFGLDASVLTLVSRETLLTPLAPEGALTDGYQTSTGSINPQMPHDHGSMHSDPMVPNAMELSTAVSSGNDASSASDSTSDSTDGITLSIELGSQWQGTYEGTLSVTNTSGAAVPAGWSVGFISEHKLRSLSDFNVQQVARADGRYDITLSAPGWAAGQELAAGAVFSSYFQAAGDLNGQTTEQLFETNTYTANTTDLATDTTTTTTTADPRPEPIPAAPTEPTTDTTNLDTNGMRVVGYFEEWGIYGRDFRVADIKADSLTHVNYSFFGITPTEADLPSMASELNVLPGGWVQETYQGLNSNIPGALGIHDPWAAYEKTFSQTDQLVSRTFSSEEWAGLSPSQKDLYGEGGNFNVTTAAGGSVTVRARADSYIESQGGLRRTFGQDDWQGLSEERKTYLVDNSADYAWTDQWQGAFTPSGNSSAAKVASVDAFFADGSGRSLSLTADGDLFLNDDAWSGADKGAWEKLYAGNLNQLRRLSELNPDLNIGFAIGGWTLSGNFSTNLDDAAGREHFTDSIIDHLEYYDFFNTVDFDWEYPGGSGLASNAFSNQDGLNFELTLEMLDNKLSALELETGRAIEISIATAGGAEKLANLNLEGIDSYVDFYNVMSYDFHGGWESQTGHQAAMTGDAGGYDVLTAIQQFQSAGVAMNKVVLGAPAYTRAWGNVAAGDSFGYQQSGDASAAPGSFEKGSYDYKDLITGIENGTYDLIWDDENKAAFIYNEAAGLWSSIETTATITGKAAYIEEQGLGGMMLWALSNDSEGEASLITAAHDLLVGGASLAEVSARAPEFDHVLGGNGLFEVSDFTALATTGI